MMLHVPRAKSMTNWASICGLRCNQKENRNTHHVGPTGIDVEHHLLGNYDTRTTIDEISIPNSLKALLLQKFPLLSNVPLYAFYKPKNETFW